MSTEPLTDTQIKERRPSISNIANPPFTQYELRLWATIDALLSRAERAERERDEARATLTRNSAGGGLEHERGAGGGR